MVIFGDSLELINGDTVWIVSSTRAVGMISIGMKDKMGLPGKIHEIYIFETRVILAALTLLVRYRVSMATRVDVSDDCLQTGRSRRGEKTVMCLNL